MKTDLIKEKINELIESETYQKDFSKLITKITSRENANILKFTTWHFPEDWDGDFNNVTRGIAFDRIKNILKDENINQWWILIPDSYFHFKNKWQIKYFFDPSKDYPVGFDPFIKGLLVRPCYPPMSRKQFEKINKKEFQFKETGPATPEQIRELRVLWNRLFYGEIAGRGDSASKLFLEIDITGPITAILKEVKRKIKDWRDDLALEIKSTRGRPKSKHSNLKLIRDIWEKTCKGKGLSRNQQSKNIQESLGYSLNPNTISKHYLSKLMTRK